AVVKVLHVYPHGEGPYLDAAAGLLQRTPVLELAYYQLHRPMRRHHSHTVSAAAEAVIHAAHVARGVENRFRLCEQQGAYAPPLHLGLELLLKIILVSRRHEQ